MRVRGQYLDHRLGHLRLLRTNPGKQAPKALGQQITKTFTVGLVQVVPENEQPPRQRLASGLA
ncbi:hypothetical protein D3C73_1635590 [compost metagenome]